MPDVDAVPLGSFCWPELSTTDQKGALAFYRALFGWDVKDQPMGPDETYSLFKLRDRDVAAAYTMRPDERQSGAPPHWNAYVRVANADESAKRAQELGGTVLAPAFDVMESGRMAVVQDPTGAVFQVWQANKSAGIRITNEPVSLCWTELTTKDPKAAEAFYTQLFGWTPKHSAPSAGMEYTEFSINGMPSIGMMAMPAMMPPETPSYWMPYFQVADVDAAAAKAQTLGGKQHVPPTDIPNTGRFSIVGDPQGAIFAVYTPLARS